jgi:hypothetical protein
VGLANRFEPARQLQAGTSAVALAGVMAVAWLLKDECVGSWRYPSQLINVWALTQLGNATPKKTANADQPILII